MAALYTFNPNRTIRTSFNGHANADFDRETLNGNNEVVAMIGGPWDGDSWVLYLNYEPQFDQFDRVWAN